MSLSDFFEPKIEELPGPKRMKTPEGGEALQFLLSLMSGNLDFPERQVPGMTGDEQAREGLFRSLMAGEGFQDPRTSPLYQGLRDESFAEEQRGAGMMRHRAQLAGGGRTSGAVRAEGDFRADMSRGRQSILGGLFESERERYGPQTQLMAADRLGSRPREVATAQAGAQYQKQFQDLMAPFNLQGPIAQDLMDPIYQPQFYQQPSGWEKLMSIFGGVGGIYNLFNPPKPPKEKGGFQLGFPTIAGYGGGSVGFQ